MKLVMTTTLLMLLLCFLLYATRHRKRVEVDIGEDKYLYSRFLIFAVFIVLIVAEGFRHGYQDTVNYKGIYNSLSDNLQIALLSELESGYVIFQWLLRKINPHPQFIIIVSAILITMADIRFIKKYAYNFVFSLYLYFLFSFTGNINGIRQILAASILTFAFPLAVRKKYLRYILVVLLASTFHKSALIVIPLLFIFSGKRWNLGLICFEIFCLFSMFFSGPLNMLVNLFATDSYANYLEHYTASANIMNVFISAVPLVMGILYHRQNPVDKSGNRVMDVLINMQAISFGFMVLATKMAQYARIGGYMRHATALVIPFLIDKLFSNNNRKIVKAIAITLYLAVFLYEAFLSNARGYYDVLYLDFRIFGEYR